ncbi:hypothetical protein COO60DRAFT_1659403 [Scenedesmus sp. NREL 46B-D3]|nr:hypothetical protein COO60DRAFT_1659403 [Scenedesmus sp. NREL 46B-D3]
MGAVTVRGLVALEDLPPSTPILSVPVSSTLRDDRAPEAYPGAPWNANLAAQLLQERQKGSASTFWPYLATLPDSCCSPLLLQEHQLPEVQYGPAMAAIASYREAVRAAYDAGQPQFSWQDWAWAVHMVQSRSIRLAITGCKVMIPGVDLLNHGGAAANGQLALGKASWQLQGEPAVCFVTSRHIAAGQQVLWSYGTRGNDDYFVYHGFALPDNPDEDVVLFEDVQQLLGWALQQMPQLQPLAAAGWDQHRLAAVAEAAAARAAQEASAFCSSGAIQGTSSSVLLPQASLSQQLRQPASRLQQQVQQQWQQQLQHGSSTALCEAAVLSGMKYLKLQRRLASFRLHSPLWGTPECPPTIPELVLPL